MPKQRKKTRSEKIAYAITILTISPFQLVLIFSFSYTLSHMVPITNDLIFYYEFMLDIISILFLLIFPLLPVYSLGKRGKIQKYTTQREDRLFLLGISLIGWFAIIPIYIWLDYIWILNLRIFIIFSIAYFIIAVINIAITVGLKFKTSLHMSGATSSITMLLITYGFFTPVPEYFYIFLSLYLFLPIIGWAKWKMQKSFERGHTIPQLISGFLIGFLITIFIIFICHLLGFPIAWN